MKLWNRISNHPEIYILIVTTIFTLTKFYYLSEYRLTSLEDEIVTIKKEVKEDVVTREIFDLQVNNLKESLADIKNLLNRRYNNGQYSSRDGDEDSDGSCPPVNKRMLGLREAIPNPLW